MSFVDPTTPNLADFITFCQGQGVTTSDLDPASPWFGYALTYAQNVALSDPCDIPSIMYVIAVYNLGLAQLIRIAPDTAPSTFFADMRKQFNLLSFVAGVVSGSSDQATSQTLAVGEGLANLPLSAINLTKTPWGQAYLEYAQMYGPNIVDYS